MMKKNDWIITLAVGFYSFLFYQQSAGINFLLFNIVLFVLLIFRNKTLLSSRTWCIALIGSLLSAIAVCWYGNLLSVIANMVSLSILAGLSWNPNSSVVFSLLYSLYSYFSSPVFMLLDWQERKRENANTPSHPFMKKGFLLIIPIVIAFLYFFMYRASNPLFNEFAKNINLDFISLSWIAFTFCGLLLLYGFFFLQKVMYFSKLDDYSSNLQQADCKMPVSFFGKQLQLEELNFSGKLLFAMLNILLLMVNVLDFNFMFNGRILPEGVSHSEFVHQGTEMSILSIIIAIAIILFYFRGVLNYFENNKWIKLLVYLWIIQNVLMLVSTAFRNDLYISEYGLTYKRIGVYVYLLLCIFGLATTFIKILKIKSNMFLFRVNGWLFYAVLVISTFINWDMLITNYNLVYPKKIERNYLAKLSNSNLPILFSLQENKAISTKLFNKDASKVISFSGSYYKYPTDEYDFFIDVSNKFYQFLLKNSMKSWKSWNYDNDRVYRELFLAHERGEVKKISLEDKDLQSLSLFKDFSKMEEFYLKSNSLNSIKELYYFPSVKFLYLKDNSLASIQGIEKLNLLEELDISGNRIRNYAPLYSLTKLKKLYVSDSISKSQYDKLVANLPNTEILKEN